MALLAFGTFNTNNADIIWIIIFITTLIATVVVSVITLKTQQRLAQAYMVFYKSKNPSPKHRYNAAFTSIGATVGLILGMILVRSPSFAENTNIVIIVGTIIIVPTILLLAFGVCYIQYRIYLHKKYCPHI